jgi:hypothetical protein
MPDRVLAEIEADISRGGTADQRTSAGDRREEKRRGGYIQERTARPGHGQGLDARAMRFAQSRRKL